jgi:hypothetical protein
MTSVERCTNSLPKAYPKPSRSIDRNLMLFNLHHLRSAHNIARPLADTDGEVINPRCQSILTSALLLGLEAAPTKPQPQQDVAAALRRSHMVDEVAKTGFSDIE